MRRCARMGEVMAKSTRDAESVAGTRQWSRGAAARFREYAVQIRDLADREQDVVIRDRLMAIADQYEALAADLESNS